MKTLVAFCAGLMVTPVLTIAFLISGFFWRWWDTEDEDDD